jgi:hypothetical protein
MLLMAKRHEKLGGTCCESTFTASIHVLSASAPSAAGMPSFAIAFAAIFGTMDGGGGGGRGCSLGGGRV